MTSPWFNPSLGFAFFQKSVFWVEVLRDAFSQDGTFGHGTDRPTHRACRHATHRNPPSFPFRWGYESINPCRACENSRYSECRFGRRWRPRVCLVYAELGLRFFAQIDLKDGPNKSFAHSMSLRCPYRPRPTWCKNQKPRPRFLRDPGFCAKLLQTKIEKMLRILRAS